MATIINIRVKPISSFKKYKNIDGISKQSRKTCSKFGTCDMIDGLNFLSIWSFRSIISSISEYTPISSHAPINNISIFKKE